MYSENVILPSVQSMQKSGLPSLLMVTHALGGGVERHIYELQTVLHNRAHVLILRPHVHAQQVQLTVPLYTAEDENAVEPVRDSLRLAFKWPQDCVKLRSWLDLLGVDRVHVHHVLGFPESFWPRLYELQLPIDLTLHDHSIFTGNPGLLDEQGHFELNWLDQGLSALPRGDEKVAQTLQSLALHAQRVIVPSHSLASAVSKLLPSLRVMVRSHPEREIDGQYPAVRHMQAMPKQAFKVLCLGMLGIEKGAYALSRTAALAAQQQLDIEFILLGACHVALPQSVRCMGLYQDADLLNLIAEIKPHLLWLPVQCPETWSYTLSAGLRAGLPVLASRLGALPERLARRPLTQLLAHTSSAEEWLSAIVQLQKSILVEHSPHALSWTQDECQHFYLRSWLGLGAEEEFFEQAYVQRHTAKDRTIEYLPSGLEQAQQLAGKSAGRWRVFLLRTIYVLSRWPLVARLIHHVPYRWQRRLKRAISRAPLDSRTLRK